MKNLMQSYICFLQPKKKKRKKKKKLQISCNNKLLLYKFYCNRLQIIYKNNLA